MKLLLRVCALALTLAGLMAASPANAGGCSQLAGTADGWNQPVAVDAAQAALAGAISDLEVKNKIAKMSITAMRAEPMPYWRNKVAEDLFLKPDVVTPKSYTVCWKGVISKVVCTSGAKVCW
jgi:hypothetical protein